MLFTMVIKAVSILGRSPSYSAPDPVQLKPGIIGDIGDYGLAIFILASFVGILLLPVYSIVFWKTKRNFILISASFLVIYTFVWFADPGGFLEWIFD